MKKNKAHKKKTKNIPSGFYYLLLAFFILTLDQGTKYLVQRHIPLMVHEAHWYPYNGIGIFENFYGVEFSIVHAINRGAAWGLFSEFQDYLFAARIFFISIMIIFVLRYNENKRFTLPFIFIIAGALGNILDYFLYDHVIDMFHFAFWGNHYPVFNIADSFICIGVGMMILVTLLNQNKSLRSSS